MTENPYAAPSIDPDHPSESRKLPPWFPAGSKKVLIMCFFTMGLYGVYWFERQFRYQKRSLGLDTWPVARAFFAIFFAHGLFEDVERSATRSSTSHAWAARQLGHVYVLCAVGGRVLDRMTKDIEDVGINVILMIVSFALIFGMAWPMSQIQATINEILTSRGVPYEPNETLTVWNYLILTLFASLILLIVSSLFLVA